MNNKVKAPKVVKAFEPCGCYKCTDYTIHRYGRTQVDNFYGFADDDLYFGMEIEVGIPQRNEEKRQRLAKLVKQQFGHLVELKWDGSIGEYGFEIATQPIEDGTFKHFLSTKKFAKLANAGLRAYDLRSAGITAGVHIHMSRKAFTPLMIVKLGTFFMINETSIGKIAGRRSNRYADFNHPLFNMRYLLEYAKGYCNSNSNRFMPLNFESESTIEVRVFQSTLNTDRLNGYLEFLSALYQFIKVAPLDQANEYEGLRFRKFAEFVINNKDVYPNLYANDVIQQWREDV